MVTPVTRPFASTVIAGISVPEPYVPADTPLFAKVAVIAVAPDPVTSPDRVMFSFAVVSVLATVIVSVFASVVSVTLLPPQD